MANEIGESLQLNLSSTFRLLVTLSQYNLVKRDEHTNQYGLGLTCLELARGYLENNNLREVALPILQALRDDVKETVHLAILDQMEVVYLEKLPGLYAIGLTSSKVGGRVPAYCTGVGKALLAHQKPENVCTWYLQNGLPRFTNTTLCDVDALMQDLLETIQRGYALDHEEHEHEVSCIAVPVFDFAGSVGAAISISGPSTCMEPLENHDEIIQKAKEAAIRISRQLGYFHIQNDA